MCEDTIPSLDLSFVTVEKIALHRTIVKLAELRHSLVLRFSALEDEKRTLRLRHAQRQEAIISELELRLASSMSVLDGRSNKTRESVKDIVFLSTKYTALLEGDVPSRESAEWFALDQEYEQTVERAKFLAAAGTDGRNNDLGHYMTSNKVQSGASHRYMPGILNWSDNQDEMNGDICRNLNHEFKNPDVLVEMRNRYEQAIKDIEQKHAEEIKNLRRLLKSQRLVTQIKGKCANSPEDTKPKPVQHSTT
eukprot:g5390.t1